MHHTSWLTSLALLACIATSAHAETKFNLQASADRAVPNDTLTVVILTESTSANTKVLYSLTNQALSHISERVKGHDGVKFKPVTRNVKPLYRDDSKGDPQVIGWSEQASVQLQSKSFAELYDLVEQVLKDPKAPVRVGSISYSLSDEAAQSVGDELYDTALKNINHRAKVVGTGLGQAEINIDELSFNGPYTSGGAPVVMMRAKVASMSAPGAMDSGESKVRVDLSGSFTASQTPDI
ncbi:SIMPL domain-containing protein [Pseudomonas fluorescens]|uniref:SIMPL domain-containing protein n=1 Tax=Pseudomonas fluorescens TaxID=294 RepID=UPI001930D714|nr:SIMPL domain-containing protein [Pseudomonas fluorescens]MBD8088987.1 SIMPL domain-containing protein [Pseudomonas fluorescens]